MEIYIAAISALIALVAVIVGPFVSLHIAKRQFLVSLDIAKRQFNATVLSVNRQNWINTLRDEIAELLTNMTRLHNEARRHKPNHDELYERIYEIDNCASKIQLLINPGEEDHRLLIDVMGRTIRLMRNPAKEGIVPELVTLSDEIISQSQKILKREWERVKEGK